uniref:RNA-dependent RNA polymerase n=1 Tax=Syphacia muris TaxID=451379 RepID=A0A0N5AAR1_9BILA
MIVRYLVVEKQLMKEQIQIPFNLGRSMFGIVDESGLLQYGQVFIQYTCSIESKTPGRCAAKKILKGKVLITKNPSVVAGDVRVFEAVDIPELQHLVDVVVFPQSGPRPHPDEMAGSDLDGDEYSIIWDPELIFDHNEEAFDFTKNAREPEEVSHDEVVAEMRNFFVKYIKQDSIGSISNAFLVNADLYGIKSEHSLSVDFPKTGTPPDPLVKKWGVSVDGVPLPPEKPERWPEFMCKNHVPFYASRRLVGQLYRRIKAVDDILTLTMASEELAPIKIDETLLVPNYDHFVNEAEEDFAAYSSYIISLMDNYGIEDEGQLYSGCIIMLRNRLSEKDNDDMSLYNTNYMIEKKVTDIFKTFRKRFFTEFGGFEACTTVVSSKEFATFEKDLRRVCKDPTTKMKAKASAYYYVCYKNASHSSGKRLLSFPWLVWDILAQVKTCNIGTRSSFAAVVDPLSASVSNFIEQYTSTHSNSLHHFMENLTSEDSGSPALLRYCRKYTGLDKIIFVICNWANNHCLLSGRFNSLNLSLLLIQFLLGRYPSSSLKSYDGTLAQVDDLLEEESVEAISLSNMVGGLGKIFIRFLQFLSSRTFENLKYIDFSEPNLGYQSKMIRGQWLELHKVALKSFYRLMLKGQFDELRPKCDLDKNIEIQNVGVTEMDPFVIEIPEDVSIDVEELRLKMSTYSGISTDCLQLRRLPYGKGLVVISARGSLDNLRRLRDLVTVESVTNSQISDEQKSNMMVRLVYERILYLCKK